MIGEQSGQNFMLRILNTLPSESGLTRIEYEGPRIALFTTNPAYFILNNNIISNMVNAVKKRIVVRTDESIRRSETECTEVLRTAFPRNTEFTKLLFDPAIGEVTVLVKDLTKEYTIDDQGNALLSEKTGWRYLIRRAPKEPELVEHVNGILARKANDRIRFYKEVGEKIFRPRLNERTEVSLVLLGGFNEIGRSCILVTTNESNVLLDCGINSFSRDVTMFTPRFDVTGLNIDDIDCVILSHAHLDHSGFLPMLFKHGYKGPIYCSEPTIPLTYLLLKSSLQLGEQNGFMNSTSSDIDDVITHMIPLPYGVVTDIAPDIRLTLSNAGHILGSSITHLHFGNGDHNLVYTGDFKFGRSLALENAYWNFQRAETLIVESTLGGKEDILRSRDETNQKLIELINSCLSGGGNLLFPVSILGQSQELLFTLSNFARSGLLSSRIFIEKSIGEASSIYETYMDYLSREIRQEIDGYSINMLRPPKSQIVESKKLRKDSHIILSPSSMLTHGPSVGYLDQICNDPTSSVIFTSEPIPNTPARCLIEGKKDLMIKDKRLNVECRVEYLTDFTNHSDYGQTLAYIKRMKQKLRKVIVNHGDKSKAQNLAGSVNRILRIHTQHPLVEEAVKLV
ncbi:MAG TPA: MBL fold metallo-hydrolase [Nitrososphaeraceae archaeon]|jgi:predicted metal-dependent RNase|nr:MBL fold metallo-hydrolase [Nitrososphaeraceae archaeon]